MGQQLSTGGAINQALRVAMRSDPDVIVLGEDVAGGGAREKEGMEEVGEGEVATEEVRGFRSVLEVVEVVLLYLFLVVVELELAVLEKVKMRGW